MTPKKEELKTLEDFLVLDDLDIQGNQLISVQELKAEAIKWVKDIRNSIPSTSNKKEDILCFTESFIKHFFNLTEEDLK